MSSSESMELEEQAAALLLRSPNLSVSDVMELLDLGDAEFKQIAERNPAVTRLLEARRQGELGEVCQRRDSELQLRSCLTCGEEYLPYAGSRYCSDTCARLALIRSRTGPKAPPTKR